MARLDTALPALTNLTLRIAYPDGGESLDIYGKITRLEPSDGAPLVRIHFTSMTPADTRAIERLVATPAGALAAGAAPAGG